MGNLLNQSVDYWIPRDMLNQMVQQSRSLDGVFQALADPTRRSMLRRLATGESSIGGLAEPFRMSFAAASKHVRVLERAGLVRRRVEGRSHICRIEPAPLAAAEEWIRFYERFWSQQLDTLDKVLIAEARTRRKRAKT
jgi:DNA-binding transcriptional ArsR family regulator